MRFRLTYANVVSTLALVFAIGGGAAFAAAQIGTRQIEANAVTTGKIAPGSVTSKRLARHAVRTKHLADRSVNSAQIAKGAVGPGKQKFPVYFVESPSGGSAPVTNSPSPYPISDATWTQNPGEINVIFGAATATLAYDGSGSGSCQVYFEIRLNGQQVGGGQLQTDSPTPVEIDQSIGAQPEIDPLTSEQNEMTVLTGSNGDCTGDSTIDSTRFRVLDFG